MHLTVKYLLPALFFLVTLLATTGIEAQFSRQDTLRGTVGPERSWWDVQRYDISVTPDFDRRSIRGRNRIEYRVLPGRKSDYLQIDLQRPLEIDTIFFDDKLYINYPGKPYYNDGNVWHIPLPKAEAGSVHSITLVYHGVPRPAVNPPWDGGWIFKKDAKGRPWMTVACQGLGASVWYPCKDHQSDEPDRGATLSMTVPDTLVAVGNGRLKERLSNANGTAIWIWEVRNPINNYNIIPYIGKYVNFTDTLMGEKGVLDLSYWVLDYNLEKARQQFGRDVKRMLHGFEYWFGPYPFYEDGYKLVESSHLGMEHQSATAYGNHYLDGYLGRDLSGTGWGMKWDYIIVHESGHEWFGNNITTNDIADMWVHEGFTDYSEPLFVDYAYGKTAGDTYCQGLRRNVRNDGPVIGHYGVNNEGSGDMYPKGANLLHNIRQLIDNDEKFRQILRGLNRDYYHQTVDSRQVEKYIAEKSGLELSKIFDQYLRTTMIPELNLQLSPRKGRPGYQVKYKWSHTVSGFAMPVRLWVNGQVVWIKPGSETRSINLAELKSADGLEVDKNFFITVKKS